jgi:hypothetical protein
MSELIQLDTRRNDFDFFTADIGDITPGWEDHKRSDGIVEKKMNTITYEGAEYGVGERFILSLCSKFGISVSIFYLFDPAEVFERIQKVHPRGRVRVVTEATATGTKCLAATAPTKSFVDFDTLFRILTKPSRLAKVRNAYYTEGNVTTVHVMNEAPWEISGEIFQQAFTLDTPIDGYGLPSIYLSLIRESNGTLLTADTKTFKSEVQLGKGSDKPEIPITRALDTFNNEEGFQALRQRMDSARTSFASLHECDSLSKVLRRCLNRNINPEQYEGIFEALRSTTGDVSQKYGIATEDSLSPKKARLLPMDCSILDLIYFDMEVITKRRSMAVNSRPLSQWVGQIIDNEYDLEGSMDEEDEENTDEAVA